MSTRAERGARRRWCDRCRRAGDHYTPDHPARPNPWWFIRG